MKAIVEIRAVNYTWLHKGEVMQTYKIEFRRKGERRWTAIPIVETKRGKKKR